MKTIVGLYNSMAEANKVKSALASSGFESEHITVIDQSSDSYRTGYEGTNPDHETVGGKIKHFFSSLSGSDDEAYNSYEQGVSKGGAMLAVTVPDERAEQTADLLEQYGASDIEGGTGYGSSSYGSTGNALGTDAGDRNFGTGTGTLAGSTTVSTTGSLTGSADYLPGTGSTTGSDLTARSGLDVNATGERVIPIVEEDLLVGKRQVQRGGVRIYSHTVETPVSESVSLHDERVVVDRRAVDRPATEADFANTGTIEVTATGEEAVVGKRSRVVEEVLVGKEATDRTEQINDTVRHTEVEVEPTTTTVGTTGVTGTTGTDFER